MRRKEISPEKLKDMVRSILPSKNREAARLAKAATNRAHRRALRRAVSVDDPKTDLMQPASQSENVMWRRGGDKLAHFIRWCENITRGMTKDEALGFVRSILPKSVVGDHAYSHWERERRYDSVRWPSSRETARRRIQSFVDSTTFRLRRAMRIDPTVHARLNESIKSRKQENEPRRLLRGIHDVEEFVRAIADDDRCLTERNTTLEIIESVEKRKGGRKAAFRFWWRYHSEQPRPMIDAA